MSGNKSVAKEQILKAIEQLEKNPNDKLGILADIGIGVVGAGAAGAAVAAFGGTSIHIVWASSTCTPSRIGRWRCSIRCSGSRWSKENLF
ncbi:hypothetical protein [Kamptonema sp. UHCC 0994]|uniref:hypothetical protein n=1 Tax=Kamptonema sp. UHCC 0994 TaxID=3031329 RepID=UPI0023B8D110|nr:hypothetical protein [Kamptonema sp. UHCC 0994]MDF0552065.1 hypothetical protein [Kamptonema sp. UHCC 0994]